MHLARQLIAAMERSQSPPAKPLKLTADSASSWNSLSLDEKKTLIETKVNSSKTRDIEDFLRDDDQLFDHMIGLMSTNKHSKKASELLTKYKRDFLKYPKLIERLQKKAVRFVINDQSWSMIENRFRSQPSLLAIAAEEFHFQGKRDVAFSLIKRHGLLDWVQKEDVRAWFASPETQQLAEVPNLFDLHDAFGTRV